MEEESSLGPTILRGGIIYPGSDVLSCQLLRHWHWQYFDNGFSIFSRLATGSGPDQGLHRGTTEIIDSAGVSLGS